MTNTMLAGRYDLVLQSATGIEVARVASFHSSQFGGVTGTPQANITYQPKLSMSHIPITQDMYFAIKFTADATQTEHTTSGTGACTVKVPFRYKDLYTGVVSKNNFTVVSAGTSGAPGDWTFENSRPYLNSQPWTTAVTYTIYRFKCPAGVVAKLGVPPLHAGDYEASSVNIQRDIVTS